MSPNFCLLVAIIIFTPPRIRCQFIFNEDIAALVAHSADLNGPLNLQNVFLINRQQPVKFLVPGYRQRTTDHLYSIVVASYLRRGNNTLITVDYARIAFGTYAECYFGLPQVEMYIAQFMRFLNIIGIPRENLHLVGHSLGGQMVGRMGNAYSAITYGLKIGRVTSLDPAKIGFESVLVHEYDKVTARSATVVDVIHTDTATVAAVEPSGTVDFYVNRGLAPQPGCNYSLLAPLIDNIPLTDGWITPQIADGTCSHGRSLQLWGQSVLLRETLVARRCDTWDVVNKVCLETGDEYALYGEDMPLSTTGIYYFNTTHGTPYLNIS